MYVEIFLTFFRLGLTSFGGPIAHLGFFRHEFVDRRRWLDEKQYADLVALCQFLPGPASSQVGIAVGCIRSGWLGGVIAWIGFTLPSAVALTLFAYGVTEYFDVSASRWIHGLKLAAVAIVAHAVLNMAKAHCGSAAKLALALASAFILLYLSNPLTQIAIIIATGLIGAYFFKADESLGSSSLEVRITPKLAAICLFTFGILLISFSVFSNHGDRSAADFFGRLYIAGSLVFGGGHVVLPLLKTQVVDAGFVSNDLFLAGYGAAQAVPGPLFTFAAYLGAVAKVGLSQWAGAALATIAIFLPSFLIVYAILPSWNNWRHHPHLRSALVGVNAGVVGILLAALISPLWATSAHTINDLAIVALGFASVYFYRLPSWALVIFCVVGAQATPFF